MFRLPVHEAALMAAGMLPPFIRRLRSTATPRWVTRVLIAVLALGAGGCSLIGLGVGAGIEAGRSREPVPVPPAQAARLRAGSVVTLVKTDSSRITGLVLPPLPAIGAATPSEELRLVLLRTRKPATLDTVVVPLADVAYVTIRRPRHAARNGFMVGLKVDLALVGLTVAFGLLALLILIAAQPNFG
jgi:hypothetical protein